MAPLAAVPALVPTVADGLAAAAETPACELVDPMTPDAVPEAPPMTCAQAGAAISVVRIARASRVVCM
jgi:hypothetical protein